MKKEELLELESLDGPRLTEIAKRTRWVERLKEWKEKHDWRGPRFEELAKKKGGQK